MMALLLNANDSVSRSYSITKPSPLHPQNVSGVGERTGNLWNEEYIDISSTLKYVSVYVGNNIVTLSSTCGKAQAAAVLFLLAGAVTSGAATDTNGVWSGTSRTVTAIDGYITIAYRAYASASPVGEDTMLNTGSTAQPYEPYGWCVPVTCGGQTTNIYLGSATSTRRIKKLVLTGEEDYTWYKSATRNYSWYVFPATIGTIANTPFLCSHGETVTSVSDYGYGKVYCDNTCNLGIFDSSINSTTKLNNYFAQQYAAGTPVTVWYVLATPETAATNEPLMKIGSYADEISKTGTGVDIPTVNGSNTLSVGTTVQPSEMSIESISQWV